MSSPHARHAPHLLIQRRANLEYNITEDERIVAQLGNRTALLGETLISHRFAISLNPNNTDILFNAAQVLSSLAEASLESGAQEAGKYEAIPLLEEAVDVFTACLERQQKEYSQMQAEIAQAQASGEYQEAWEGKREEQPNAQEQDMETSSASSDGPGDWATVEEPVTPETILETCTAQLGALTSLVGLYDPSTDLSNIEKRVQDGLQTANTIIPALIQLVDNTPPMKPIPEPQAGPTLSIGSASTEEEATTTPRDDAILAAAHFQASIAEVTYRSASSNSTQYAQAVEQAFGTLTKAPAGTSGPGLAWVNIQSAYADALMDIASALADGPQYAPTSPTFATDTEIQWTALTQAQSLLTQLSSAPYTSILAASRLADIFIARGDTDLFRFRISLFETAKPAWRKSGPVLLANSGVFYRGARSYAEKAGALELRKTADAKAIVAEILKEVNGGSKDVKDSWKGRSIDLGRVLEQMVEEGIVSRENVEGVLTLAQ